MTYMSLAEWFSSHRLDLVGSLGGRGWEIELAAETPGDEVPS